MTQPNQSTAIAVLNQYPADKFNLLIPVRSIQEISPVHKVIVNEVQINPDPDKGQDVYKELNSNKLALTKKGLAKLMAAANIQVVDSRPIPTQKCNKCHEMARATRVAPKCFECPYQDDVACQVTIAIPEPSGTFRLVKKSKELRMVDERNKAKSDKQFQRFFQFRTEHCETKALNRAIREGLMIQSGYEPQELQKPFAVGLVVPNFADPDLKQAMIQRCASGASDLFAGGKQQIEANAGDAPQLEAGNVTELPEDEPPAFDVSFTADEAPNFGNGEDTTTYINCEGDDCGFIIEDFTDGSGKRWEAEAFAVWTKDNLGRQMCAHCAEKAIKERQRAHKKGA